LNPNGLIYNCWWINMYIISTTNKQ
jgi:hypothetical protein